MNNVDTDDERMQKDEYGNIYPIDADSQYGVTLEQLEDK